MARYQHFLKCVPFFLLFYWESNNAPAFFVFLKIILKAVWRTSDNGAQQMQLLIYQPKPFILDSIIFDIATKCCTSWRGPADVAVSPLLPVEDTPPPPPLLPPSCLLHAAGFRKRKREYWCVFRKVWTSLTFWNQRYIYRKQVTVSYRNYTRTSFDTVKRN